VKGHLGGYVAHVLQYSKSIQDAADKLKLDGRLVLERRNEDIRLICEHAQCRMKTCFVQAEKKIMMSTMCGTIELLEKYFQVVGRLKEKKFIREEHSTQIAKRHASSRQTLVENAQKLGFKDTEDLCSVVASTAGGSSQVGGYESLKYGHASSFAAWASLRGLGPTALSEACLLKDLTSAGLVFLSGTAGLAISVLFQAIEQHGETYSKEIEELMAKAFDAFEAANGAAAKHITALVAISNTLCALEVQTAA